MLDQVQQLVKCPVQNLALFNALRGQFVPDLVQIGFDCACYRFLAGIKGVA